MSASTDSELAGSTADVEDGLKNALEGRLLTGLHVRRERNKALVERRKARALKQQGVLRCEACELDFGERYGKRGAGFIEVHHTRPLYELPKGGRRASTSSHSYVRIAAGMVHRRRPWLKVEEVAAIVRPS